MSDERPFREPCDGISLCGLGSLWQHGTNTQISVAGTNNTTLVPNPAGGPDISPYERWTQDFSGGLSCEVHHCVTDPGAAPCAEFLKPFPTNTFAFSGTNIDFSVCHKQGFKNVQARRNWHGALPWTAPEAGCQTNVCAGGSGWQAYQSTASQTKYLTVTYDVHFSNLADFDGSSDSGDLTGARTVNATSGEITSTVISTETIKSGQITPGTPVITYFSNGGAGYNYDVGTATDIPFASGGTTKLDSGFDLHCGFPAFNPGGSFGSLADYVASWNTGHPSAPLPAITDPNNYSGHASDTLFGTTQTVDAEFSRTGTTVSWDFSTSFPSDNPGAPLVHYSYNGSVTLSDTNASSTVLADLTDNLLSLWPLDDDSLYPWRTDLKVSVAPLVSRLENGPTSPIGFNPYTVDDLTAPIDDADGHAPFSGSWAPTYSQRAWFDPAAYQWTFAPGTDATNAAATGLLLLFDGSILGSPKPAGYQNFFDFGYIDMVGCCYRPPDNPGFQTWSWYQVGWGMNVSTFNSNAGCHLPLNATQWNNYFQAINKPQGAWIFYADKGNYYGAGCVSSEAPSSAGDAGALVACKYAEILEMWPSQNFARPAGDDKFIFDENHVFCAVNLSGSGAGSTWTLTDPISGVAPADGTDFTGYWGGPVVGGFYNVTGYSGGTLTLGSKVYNVPSNWASKSNADDAFCFGKVRFPTAPSLLGRVQVTPDVAGTTFTFSIAQPNFGMNSSTHQEAVDLYDQTMTLVASNITATRANDSTFTTGAAWHTAKWVQIHGAAKWYVNDTRPKGDFALLEWLSDFRSKGEYDRLTGVLDCSSTQVTRPTANVGGGDVANLFASFTQTEDCLPFGRCNPRVVCISPNGESFPNGVTYPFPETFAFDEQYGSKWWAFVQSTMSDLFWQQPHRPCNIKPCAKWQMDGGLCADDQPWDGSVFACAGDPDFSGESVPPVYYYGHAPQVEARLTVPATYGMSGTEAGPSLPSGVQIGWLSPVDHSSGEIALPPLPPGALQDNGEPAGASVTWYLHGLFCTYYTPGCRFGDLGTLGCPPP
jgi:hypothetical protein